MDRYRIFRRGRTWYLENAATGRQTSLHTRDRREALRVLHAKHEAQENPSINVQIARAYLHVADAGYTTRKWLNVFQHIIDGYEEGSESRRRWRIVEKDKAFDFIRHKLVAETRAEDFLAALQEGTVSTNVYLRRVQNYALGMNWLIVPIVPKKLFPAVRHKARRAITQFEHERILGREPNPERHAFYELLWHTGGSQGDIAKLHAQDIDKADRVISFQRCKTRWRELQPASFKYGRAVEALLEKLPQIGPLFPHLATVRSSLISPLSALATAPPSSSNAAMASASPALRCTRIVTPGPNERNHAAIPNATPWPPSAIIRRPFTAPTQNARPWRCQAWKNSSSERKSHAPRDRPCERNRTNL